MAATLGNGNITFGDGTSQSTAAVPLTGGTMTGALEMSGTSPQIKFTDTSTSQGDFWAYVDSGNFYILADRASDGAWETPHPLQLDATNNIGYLFGNTILNSNNYGSYALPLSGGSMSGDIAFGSSDKGLTWAKNTDGAGIYFVSTNDGSTGVRANSNLEFSVLDNDDEGFRFTSKAGSTVREVMYANYNQFQYKGNDVLHSGNYSSYTVPKSGGQFDGTVKISAWNYIQNAGTSDWTNLVTIPSSYDHVVGVRARFFVIENSMPSWLTLYFHGFVRHNGSPYGDGYNMLANWDANTQYASSGSVVSFKMFQDAGNGPIRIQVRNSIYHCQFYLTSMEGYGFDGFTWG